MSFPISGMHRYDEIKDYIYDHIEEWDWDDDLMEDVHQGLFNTDYYIVGIPKAVEWLGDKWYECIKEIIEYETDNFGNVTTDVSCPERIVNMYTYILGEMILQEYFKEED